MIKVKADRVEELTKIYGYKSYSHPQLGMIVEKNGIIFSNMGQLLGVVMPLPLLTAQAIAELVNNDLLIEDTGLALSSKLPQAPLQQATQKKSVLIGV